MLFAVVTCDDVIMNTFIFPHNHKQGGHYHVPRESKLEMVAVGKRFV